MIQASFEEKKEYGEEGEKQIADWLMDEKDVSIIPFYQFEPKKAPVLFFNKEVYILPDLLCAKKGSVFFVECKRKKRWVYWNGIAETGINQAHLQEYKMVQEITGLRVLPVFIMPYLNQKTKGGLYILSNIHKDGRLWDGKSKSSGYQISKPIYFWKSTDLIYIEGFKP